MRRKVLLLTVGALLCMACAPSTVETPGYTTTMLLLPEGQPEAGREVFLSLGCFSCHTVAWDTELPAPVSATPGPELGLDRGKLGPGGLATSIVAPSHHVPEQYRAPATGNRSPMTDYSGVMTIRQLSDIVAYLERQGLETRAKTGQAPG
jgi:mono/diheme cytochrome c family protein